MITLFAAALLALSVARPETADLRGARPALVAVAWNANVNGPGYLQALEAAPPFRFVTPPVEVGVDSSLHLAGDRLFAVSRFVDELRVIDTSEWRAVGAYRLPAGSKAIGVAVDTLRNCAYVIRSENARLLRVDLASGLTRESLDLAPFAGAVASLRPGSVLIHERRMYVSFSRIPGVRWLPPGIAVVDLDSRQFVDVDPRTPHLDAIRLFGTAVRGRMQVIGARPWLFVCAAGEFWDEGGIEAVDLAALRSSGLAIREVDGQVGTDLHTFVMLSPERGYLSYSTDIVLSSHLHAFRPFEGVSVPELDTSLFYATAALVHDPVTDRLFVPHSFDSHGVRVFDAETGEPLNEQPTAAGGPITNLLLIPRLGR